MSVSSLNIANNNFGNIKTVSGGWATYATPQAGVDAISNLIGRYQSNYGLNTVSGIINRYAPQSDPGNAGKSLVADAASVSNLDANTPYDFSPGTAANQSLTRAILSQEGNSAYAPLVGMSGGDTLTIDPSLSFGDPSGTFFLPGSSTPLDSGSAFNPSNTFLTPGTDNPLIDAGGNIVGDPTAEGGTAFDLGGALSGNAAGSGASDWFSRLLTTISDIASRGGLILLGALIILVGAWAALKSEEGRAVIRKVTA